MRGKVEQNDFNIKLIFIMINSEYRTVLVASDGYYSLVPNRRGGWNKRGGGGLEKSPKHNKRVGWNSRGVGNDAAI